MTRTHKHNSRPIARDDDGLGLVGVGTLGGGVDVKLETDPLSGATVSNTRDDVNHNAKFRVGRKVAKEWAPGGDNSTGHHFKVGLVRRATVVAAGDDLLVRCGVEVGNCVARDGVVGATIAAHADRTVVAEGAAQAKVGVATSNVGDLGGGASEAIVSTATTEGNGAAHVGASTAGVGN